MTAKEKPPVAEKEQDIKEQPLISHLVELRDRIVRAFIAVIVVFLALVYWANDIYTFVAEPLTSVLDPAVGEHMIATRVLDPFLAPFKLTFMVAVFICIPYLLHQAWAFISPGLYKNEIRITLPIIISSVVLFPDPGLHVRVFHQYRAGKCHGSDRYHFVSGFRYGIVSGVRTGVRNTGSHRAIGGFWRGYTGWTCREKTLCDHRLLYGGNGGHPSGSLLHGPDGDSNVPAI